MEEEIEKPKKVFKVFYIIVAFLLGALIISSIFLLPSFSGAGLIKIRTKAETPITKPTTAPVETGITIDALAKKIDIFESELGTTKTNLTTLEAKYANHILTMHQQGTGVDEDLDNFIIADEFIVGEDPVDLVPPSNVQNLSIVPLNQGATLTWDKATDAETGIAGYKVYYGLNSIVAVHQEYENKIDVGNMTSYQVSGLENGVTYYFSVVAYDHAGNESIAWSNEVSVVPKSANLQITPTINIKPKR